MKEENRIYVVLPAVVEVGSFTGVRLVAQPHGRQIAQACHVVSKLRHSLPGQRMKFKPITTIVLQARDTNELVHIFMLLSKTFDPITFQDENEAAYGKTRPTTALAVLAAPNQMKGVLDYLPLWGS